MTAVRAKKRYGQHFLEPQWADKLVAAIDPRPADRFLEIGPGPGALTLRLAPRVAQLTAVEVDLGMIDALTPRLPPNATLVHADFREFDLASLEPGPLRVAGNLPYNVSSPILFKLLEIETKEAGTFPGKVPASFGSFGGGGTDSGSRPKGASHQKEAGTFPGKVPASSGSSGSSGRGGPTLVDATLMVQREVADRITAPPGGREYGVLAILVQLRADVRQVLTLPPGAFRPAPKVRSAVVALRFRPPAVGPDDDAVFAAMVRSMFTQRRKTLANALRAFAESAGAKAPEALAAAGIDPRRRPETLQLNELVRLADVFAASRRRAVL